MTTKWRPVGHDKIIKKLFAPLWSVTVTDRVCYVKNGKVLYRGPRDEMPADLGREFDAWMTEADSMIDEARKELEP